MAKDRNTTAKRQREVEKKRKAEEKRARRAQRKRNEDESEENIGSPLALPPAEQAVLEVFRKYLMPPGQMLCLGSSDLERFKIPLAHLTRKGLLVAEKFQGGYSLTAEGFAAMQDVE